MFVMTGQSRFYFILFFFSNIPFTSTVLRWRQHNLVWCCYGFSGIACGLTVAPALCSISLDKSLFVMYPRACDKSKNTSSIRFLDIVMYMRMCITAVNFELSYTGGAHLHIPSMLIELPYLTVLEQDTWCLTSSRNAVLGSDLALSGGEQKENISPGNNSPSSECAMYVGFKHTQWVTPFLFRQPWGRHLHLCMPNGGHNLAVIAPNQPCPE